LHTQFNQLSLNMAAEVASQPDAAQGITGDRARWSA
jgi:hypothetical protein